MGGSDAIPGGGPISSAGERGMIVTLARLKLGPRSVFIGIRSKRFRNRHLHVHCSLL